MSKAITKPPLLVIIGETGSGKTALAITLAEQFGGEILCADSRTVYKDMDIGTAKPSAADQARVQHFGLDLVAPNERFTAADFKHYGEGVIDDITSRSKLPIMVGGTGLYIDALLYDFQFRPTTASTGSGEASDQAWQQRRAELSALSVDELQRSILEQGYALPENARNPRHLVRVLETGGAAAVRSELRPNTLILGVRVDRDVLRRRIETRVDQMLAAGLVDEVRRLARAYGWDCASLQAPGYKAMRGYIEDTKSLEEAKAEFIKNDMDLAKRQRTWFRRNKSIQWLTTEDKQAEAVALATTFLNK